MTPKSNVCGLLGTQVISAGCSAFLKLVLSLHGTNLWRSSPSYYLNLSTLPTRVDNAGKRGDCLANGATVNLLWLVWLVYCKLVMGTGLIRIADWISCWRWHVLSDATISL